MKYVDFDTLDYSNLNRKVSYKEIYKFTKNNSEIVPNQSVSFAWDVVLFFAFFSFVIPFTIYIVMYGFGVGASQTLITLAIIAAVAVWIYNATLKPILRIKTRQIKLIDFAKNNNLELWLNSAYKKSTHKSELFSMFEYMDLAIVFSDAVEVGVLTDGSGESKNCCTYVCLKLGKPVPNIVIDAKVNNLFGYDKKFIKYSTFEQNLDLEGDFINTFKLYAPGDFKQDALYILTPDFMKTLTEEFYMFDIEFIDDRVYLFKSDVLDVLNADEYTKLSTLINSMIRGLSKRLKRYDLANYYRINAHDSESVEESDETGKAITINNRSGKKLSHNILYKYAGLLPIAGYLNFILIDAWSQTRFPIIIFVAAALNIALIAVFYITYKKSKEIKS